MQSLWMKSQGAKEKFDSSLSNHIIGVQKSVISLNFSVSILYNEIVQDEEIEKSSTHSIWIGESLLWVTPSPVSLEVYEISDISYSHTTNPEE